MSKKKRNKNYKDDPDKLCKRKLLSSELEKYKQIGVVDHSQNWLELFTPTIVSDLFTIMHSCSDNQLKAKYIQQELSYYGFTTVGLGTNIYTMANPAYPGVVFKFALDDNGLADNFNDPILEQLVNEHLGEKRYTAFLARHPSGIVSVQQRKVLISDQDRMDTFRGSILKALKKLSEIFLIVDLSPTHYQFNYGIDRNGDWCFVDASDLYPLENIKKKVQCHKAVGYDEKKREVKRCNGMLRYNADFSAIVCSRCGMEFLPLEIKPKDKEDKKMAYTLTDGVLPQDRERWRQEEIAAARGVPYVDPDSEEVKSAYPSKDNPMTVFVDPHRQELPVVKAKPDDDDDDDMETEGPTTGEPASAPMSFSEFLGKRPEPESDEDEDEDDEGDVAKATGVAAVVNAFEGESDGDDEDSDDSGEEDDEPVEETESTLEYKVVNYDPSMDDSAAVPTEELPGIHICINGDFEKAYAEYGLPVYVSLDGGKSVTQVISAEAMRTLLEPGVNDAIEDMNAIRGS